MSSRKGLLTALIDFTAVALGRSRRADEGRAQRGGSERKPDARWRTPPAAGAQEQRHPRNEQADAAAGRPTGSQTVQLNPDRLQSLRIAFAPDRDGAPDAGEVIWTWVPYVENDGRGKDRPLLVIGRQSRDRVYAVRMTSRPHDGDRDFLSIGSGPWDSHRRESWVDIEQLYSVHEQGLRREAATLDRPVFDRVARALSRRYGWASAA